MTIELIFAWYDLWVGAYWDRAHRRLYVLPVPCVGFVIQFARPVRKPKGKLFEKLASIPEPPPCPRCGRSVLAGACCEQKGPSEVGVQFDSNGRITHVMTADIPSKFTRYRKA